MIRYIENVYFCRSKELFKQNEVPPWGLIVLLVAKATGIKANNNEEDSSAGALVTFIKFNCYYLFLSY